MNSENQLSSQNDVFSSGSTCPDKEMSGNYLVTGAFGMNGQNNSRFEKENSSSAVLPFANSVSSTLASDDDDIIHLGETKGPSSLTESPQGSNILNKSSDFKLPSTPLNIFSRKTNRVDKKSPKPNMIASMFARQVKRNSAGSPNDFNPSQVSLDDSSSNGSDEDNSSRNKKRPREKKLKL